MKQADMKLIMEALRWLKTKKTVPWMILNSKLDALVENGFQVRTK